MDDPSASPAPPSPAAAVHLLLEQGQAEAALAQFSEDALNLSSDGVDALVAMEIAALVGDRPGARAAFAAFSAQDHTEVMVHEAGAALEWALGHRDAAAAHDDWLTEHIKHRGRWRYLLRAARRWSEAGAHDKAASRAEQFLAWRDGSLRTRLQAITVLWDAGDFAQAQQRLQDLHPRFPDAAEPLALLGRLSLWRGAYGEAAAFGVQVCDRDANAVYGWRLQGAAAVCMGESEKAIPFLDQALSISKSDVESAIWRAEAYLRLGRWEDAQGDIEANLRVAGHVTVALVRMWDEMLRSTRRAAAKKEKKPRPHDLDPKRGLYARLAPLASPEEWAEAKRDPQHTQALLVSILDSFRGNRSARPTIVPDPKHPDRGRRGHDGEAVSAEALVHASLGVSPRQRSAGVLRDLPQLGPGEVRKRLAALRATYPDSPHPYCYQGELELWMGDLDAAMKAFHQGHRRILARWAFIGKMAVRYLRGQFWRARWTGYRLKRSFEPLPASTLPVYRGEGMRRAGKHDAAVQDLRVSIRFKSTRLGSRINLVLSLAALGRRDDALSELAEVARRAPSLIWAAERGLGAGRIARDDLDAMTPVLERALVMMRANRSSTRLSYFMNETDAEEAIRMPIAARISVEFAKDLAPIIAALNT